MKRGVPVPWAWQSHVQNTDLSLNVHLRIVHHPGMSRGDRIAAPGNLSSSMRANYELGVDEVNSKHWQYISNCLKLESITAKLGRPTGIHIFLACATVSFSFSIGKNIHPILEDISLIGHFCRWWEMDKENAHTVTNTPTIFDMACGKFLPLMQMSLFMINRRKVGFVWTWFNYTLIFKPVAKQPCPSCNGGRPVEIITQSPKVLEEKRLRLL